jgi:hypothetical protein
MRARRKNSCPLGGCRRETPGNAGKKAWKHGKSGALGFLGKLLKEGGSGNRKIITEPANRGLLGEGGGMLVVAK